MARRATAFDRLRAAPVGAKIMLIAGPNEILPSEDGDERPDPKVLPAMAKAYGMLGYTAGYVASAEARALAKAGATLPAGFVAATDEPQKAVYTVGGNKIGVVFFPDLGKAATPGENAVRAIEREAESLRGQVKLVIGISPWGSDAERAYLERGKPAVDILLGAGPGIGLTARPDASGKVLWMRPFGKGKTLDALDILAWPGDKDFKWLDKGTFMFQIITLGEEFASKPEVEALFDAVDGKAKDVKAK